MCHPAIAIVCGIAVFQMQSRVPPPALYLAFPALAWLLLSAPRWRFIGWCGIGFLWAMWRADLALGGRLDPAYAGRPLTAIGTIQSIPVGFGAGSRFDFAVERLADLRGGPVRAAKLKLSWFDAPPDLAAGVRCTLKVRLKLPTGARNPGGYDREKWLFSERVSAVGYVLAHPANRCAGARAVWSLGALRERLAARIDTALGGVPGAAVVTALAVGDRGGLGAREWEILRDSGTAHLLAISGLHISLVAVAAFVLARWSIALLTPAHRQWPAQRPAALIAIGAACAYAALAGFPVSTQRALVMLTVAMLSLYWRRPVLSFHSFATALAVVAIVDPFALLSAGYWLSFCAVGWLSLINATRPRGNLWRRLLRVHVLLALGLTPLLGALHQTVPIVAPLANLVAVPVVSFCIVPLVLGGIMALALDAGAAASLWRLAAWIWELLWDYVAALTASIGAYPLPVAPGVGACLFAFAGVVVLVVPVLRFRVLLGGVLIAALLLERPDLVAPRHVRMTVLDVGQGLAVVVQTTRKTLVYDTGPAFARFSAGADIVAPMLRARGIDRIDRVILSHGDADHAGGWAGLSAAIAIRETWVSPGHTLAAAADVCAAGQRWRWDGVEFEILYPAADSGAGSRNELSCVLKITAPGGSVLLPGDIEQGGEGWLLNKFGDRLGADILVAPHHGSSSSSSEAFVTAVGPAFVVFAAAYQNRFGFPRREVVARYTRHRAKCLTTGAEGAIEFYIGDAVAAPVGYRREHLRYWHQYPEECPAGAD